MSDTIDRKQFKNKYRQSIENGIKKSFINLYPNKEIIVKYISDHGDYYFNVYINGETFAKQEIPLIIDNNIYVDRFVNHLAITLFSDIPKDEYYKVYDDYKPENYTWLRDEVEKLQKEYEAKGVIFDDITIEKGRWRIECYHPENGEKNPYYRPNDIFWSYNHKQQHPDIKRACHSGRFALYPISMATAKSVLSKCKSTMNRALKGKS